MMQNPTQFVFSVLFILSIGALWGTLYWVYQRAKTKEIAEDAAKVAQQKDNHSPEV